LIAVMGTLLLAASLLFPAAPAGQMTAQALGPAPRLSLLDVPYLSQTEALCGGAAAAMVLRYWGAAGIAAEEFAPLVDPKKDGIETTALARAVRERGYRALSSSGTAAMVQRELTAGRPVIALIEDRPKAFHYVVIVGWHARAVVLHDPARTPYRLMNPQEFERRWQASHNWMLVVAPFAPVQSPGSESQFRVPVQSHCDRLVVDGIRLAQQNDLAAAERLLADAAYQCSSAAPLRELAGVRLLQRRWPEVRDLAGRAIEMDPADAHSWRLLATARYITGDSYGALDAWNRAGEPAVDLVSVDGLQRTSHRVVERFLGIRAGSMLTRAGAERARRRLEELPAAAMTGLEYVPRGSGNVDVQAHIVERTVLPQGLLTWGAAGLRAAALREIAVPVAGLGHGGERLDIAWRFWRNRPAAGIALHVPASFGLFSMELWDERQPFNVVDVPDAQRLVGRLRVANWITPVLRWEGRGGFARWRHAGAFGVVGGAVRIEGRGARAGVEADAWLGDHSFATTLLRGGWRSSGSRRGFAIDLSAGVETVTNATPLDLWAAGDTGHARGMLLRAHPVLDEGRLRVERLGQHLAQASSEAQYWWRPAGVLPIAAAIFVDAARVNRRRAVAGEALVDVDAGAGFRLSLPGRTGLFRVDVAHGLRDGRNAVSLSWSPE
jgi:predicted double-glycine peptidase